MMPSNKVPLYCSTLNGTSGIDLMISEYDVFCYPVCSLIDDVMCSPNHSTGQGFIFPAEA